MALYKCLSVIILLASFILRVNGHQEKIMTLSIPNAHIPPPGHFSGILLLCPPQGGAFAVTGQPGCGALSKAILSFRF